MAPDPLWCRVRHASWRAAAARRGLRFLPAADVPSGADAGVPFTRGVDRHLTHVLAGPATATVALGDSPSAARVRPLAVAVGTYHTTIPLPGQRGAAPGRYTVAEAHLPARLPALTLADPRYAAAFGHAPASVPALTGSRALHGRFEVTASHLPFALAALTPPVVSAALDLPAPAHLSLVGTRARLVTDAADDAEVALARLDRLCAVIAALPAGVWRVAGLPVTAPPPVAAGWEWGLPGRRPQLEPSGPHWR